MKPKWTVLVYMVADTGDSFYQDAMADITEMMEAKFDERVRVVVHADAPAPWQTKCWEVTGASDVAVGGSATAKMGVAREVPCHDKNVLDFVQNVVDNYESDYYLLVLWGHGEGIDWKEKVLAGRASSSTIQGAGKRFALGSQNAIEVGELGKSLAEMRLEKVKRENVVVGFDACLMGMVEVFDEIHQYVGWAVAAATRYPIQVGLTRRSCDGLELTLRRFQDAGRQHCRSLCGGVFRQSNTDEYHRDSSGAKLALLLVTFRRVLCFRDTMGPDQRVERMHTRNPRSANVVKEARDFAEDLREKAYVDLYAFCSELDSTDRTESGVSTTEGCRKQRDECDKQSGQHLSFVTEFKFSIAILRSTRKMREQCRSVSHNRMSCWEVLPDLQVNWGSYKESDVQPDRRSGRTFSQSSGAEQPVEAG